MAASMTMSYSRAAVELNDKDLIALGSLESFLNLQFSRLLHELIPKDDMHDWYFGSRERVQFPSNVAPEQRQTMMGMMMAFLGQPESMPKTKTVYSTMLDMRIHADALDEPYECACMHDIVHDHSGPHRSLAVEQCRNMALTIAMLFRSRNPDIPVEMVITLDDDPGFDMHNTEIVFFVNVTIKERIVN